jgi:succinate dehydrogenase flavin-adding protein (antitoxin of CptAB toxin-antitoxin module)
MDRAARLRRLRLAVHQRGVLEVEFFLIPFVTLHAAALTDAQLDGLETLLQLDDLDLLEVLLDRRDPPAGVDPALIRAIRERTGRDIG